jgi:hypothetical protein
MSCQGRWPCCCNRASQCLGCDSDPTGGEYEYVVLVRFGARESSTYDSTTGKYLPDFDFSSPERFLSLKLNGQDLPIPHLVDRNDYNNDYYYYWYWNYHYYGWAVYYTNPNVLGPIVNATRCPCLNDVTSLYGWTYYWFYNSWYEGPEFLRDPSTQYIPISKGAFQANNNDMDLRFSSLPFNLDEWPTENPLKTANADVNFVVIRFKNGIPECVSTKSKLSAELRSQEYDYSTNGNWYYWWGGWNGYSGYWGLGAGDGYLPGSNQPYGTPTNCSWPFSNTNNYYGYWWGWYGGYADNTSRSLDKYWSKGGHTYFDLCAYEQDSIPPCGGGLPATLNVTIVTKCLGTQTAQVSAAAPVYYDYDNTQPIPYTYTNCGNFTEIQADNSIYYLFAYAGYKQPYYNESSLSQQLKDCSFPLSRAEASYYLINKTNRTNGFIDLGVVPNAQERYLTSVLEYFIDDGNYYSEPTNPIIPDAYRYPDGTIILRSGIIQSWKIGDPYDYYYYNYYYNTYDYYYVCEQGSANYKNKHDNIEYHDWPMTIKNQPIICNPFVTGPSLGTAYSYHYLTNMPIVSRFESFGGMYGGSKTSPFGSQLVNGQSVKVKVRTWYLYGIDHIWSTNCHSCEVGYRTAHPPITVTP